MSDLSPGAQAALEKAWMARPLLASQHELLSGGFRAGVEHAEMAVREHITGLERVCEAAGRLLAAIEVERAVRASVESSSPHTVQVETRNSNEGMRYGAACSCGWASAEDAENAELAERLGALHLAIEQSPTPQEAAHQIEADTRNINNGMEYGARCSCGWWSTETEENSFLAIERLGEPHLAFVGQPREPHLRPWRVGRKVGRAIYAENTGGASDPISDPFIGVMDTRELALRAVEDHNRSLFADAVERPVEGEARERFAVERVLAKNVQLGQQLCHMTGPATVIGFRPNQNAPDTSRVFCLSSGDELAYGHSEHLLVAVPVEREHEPGDLIHFVPADAEDAGWEGSTACGALPLSEPVSDVARVTCIGCLRRLAAHEVTPNTASVLREAVSFLKEFVLGWMEDLGSIEAEGPIESVQARIDFYEKVLSEVSVEVLMGARGGEHEVTEAQVRAAAKAMLKVRFPNARWESVPLKRCDKMMREARETITAFLAAARGTSTPPIIGSSENLSILPDGPIANMLRGTSTDQPSPVYEIERDRHGLMYSGPLKVGECVRVVPLDSATDQGRDDGR